MKRIMTSILALALAASMCVPAFAENRAQITNDSMGATIEVTGNFNAADEADTVIFADVTWDNLTFTYQDGDKSWDAVNHKDIVGEGKWVWSSAEETKTAPAITVTNHSNTKILATFDFAAELDGIEGTFTKKEIGLDSAVGTALNEAPTGSVEFSISGSKISEDQKIGTITVNIQGTSATLVETEYDLNTVLKGNNSVRLAKDILLVNDGLKTNIKDNVKNCEVDLNGFSLAYHGPWNATVALADTEGITFKNGTIEKKHNSGLTAVSINYSSTVDLENCTLVDDTYYALVIDSGTANVKDCTIDCGSSAVGAICIGAEGTLILSGDVKIQGTGNTGITVDSGTVKALAGTYNFDVSGYVDTDIYSVTNDGTTWTVTEK